MTDPKQPPPEPRPANANNATSYWRLIVAIPIYFLGCFYLLALILTPRTLQRAVTSIREVGWDETKSDVVLLETLNRAIFAPLLGTALILLAISIHRRRRTYFWAGCVVLLVGIVAVSLIA